MRKVLLSTILILNFIILTFSSSAKEENVVYEIDPNRTNVVWFGKKPTGTHSGSLKISEGYITLKGDNIVNVNIEFDMNSIINTDIKDPGYNQKLVSHLKSADFFDVANYPTARFSLTKSKKLGKGQYAIYGDLTIKGVKLPIEFPGILTVSDNGSSIIFMTSSFPIDRTLFGIKYNSPTYFTNLGDMAVANEFEIEVAQLFARRKQ